MTNCEKIKSMSREELIMWLSWAMDNLEEEVYGWFDEKYCSDCEPETGFVKLLNKECECSFCELNNKCRFFKSLPDELDIISMWLDEEYKHIGEDKNVCD